MPELKADKTNKKFVVRYCSLEILVGQIKEGSLLGEKFEPPFFVPGQNVPEVFLLQNKCK
jgi:hypothetical protein